MFIYRFYQLLLFITEIKPKSVNIDHDQMCVKIYTVVNLASFDDRSTISEFIQLSFDI